MEMGGLDNGERVVGFFTNDEFSVLQMPSKAYEDMDTQDEKIRLSEKERR